MRELGDRTVSRARPGAARFMGTHGSLLRFPAHLARSGSSLLVIEGGVT